MEKITIKIIGMMREANLSDTNQIIELEKGYYDGYSISETILTKWIANGNFFVIEENSKIVGSIYFEFLDEIKNLPWEHQPIKEFGKFIYISEIAIASPEKTPILFDRVLKTAKSNKCQAIIWLTGEGENHDKTERDFLRENDFKLFKKVDNWECSPGHFVSDHSLWIKKIK